MHTRRTAEGSRPTSFSVPRYLQHLQRLEHLQRAQRLRRRQVLGSGHLHLPLPAHPVQVLNSPSDTNRVDSRTLHEGFPFLDASLQADRTRLGSSDRFADRHIDGNPSTVEDHPPWRYNGTPTPGDLPTLGELPDTDEVPPRTLGSSLTAPLRVTGLFEDLPNPSRHEYSARAWGRNTLRSGAIDFEPGYNGHDSANGRPSSVQYRPWGSSFGTSLTPGEVPPRAPGDPLSAPLRATGVFSDDVPESSLFGSSFAHRNNGYTPLFDSEITRGNDGAPQSDAHYTPRSGLESIHNQTTPPNSRITRHNDILRMTQGNDRIQSSRLLDLFRKVHLATVRLLDVLHLESRDRRSNLEEDSQSSHSHEERDT